MKRKSDTLVFDDYLDGEVYYNEDGYSTIDGTEPDYQTDDMYDEEESKKYEAIDTDYEQFNKITEDIVEEEPATERIVNNSRYSSKKNYKNSNYVTRKVTYVDDREDYETTPVLSFISTWFSRLGVVVAIILIAYFIITAQFKNLILYIIGLIVSFFFGYFFMFLLLNNDDKSKE